MPFPSRKEFEAQGNASFGVVYLEAGDTTTINGWAFLAVEPTILSAADAKVYNKDGGSENLAALAIPAGMQIPLPYCTSLSISSGSGFLIRTSNER